MIRNFPFRPPPCALAAALTLACASAGAALHGRNLDADATTFEAHYDDVLDITWQANANLSMTEQFGLPQSFDLGVERSTAFAWIEAMNAQHYLGFSDWRLPATRPINGSDYVLDLRGDGSSDVGAGMSAPGTPYAGSTASEMAHLYYVTLGNLPGLDASAAPTPCFLAGVASCLVNPGPFVIRLDRQPFFWSGTTTPTGHAFAFDFGRGLQAAANTPGHAFAWAVRDGDVAAIPEPETWALLLAGLVAVGTRARHRPAGTSTSAERSFS